MDGIKDLITYMSTSTKLVLNDGTPYIDATLISIFYIVEKTQITSFPIPKAN